MGFTLLAGGAEFGGQMEIPDRRALDLAGGPDTPISIIPGAAVPHNDHQRAGQNGVKWFQHLGATNVTSLPLFDRTSAEDSDIIEHLRRSKLIYLLGGSPQHLGLTLAESGSRQAILEAYKAGAVIGGSSAGAMVLCDHYYDPSGDNVFTGLGLVPGCCVLPHHDTFGQNWAPRLTQLLPEAVLIGIDEQTGMLDDAEAGEWQVYGKGTVTLYPYGHIRSFGPGRPFGLDPV